ncbi:Wzy polymerase domain-containing protein [Vibrio sp. F74]|uniref:PglL family O-oligosaccharyltransferase n=1 Tax=Vibrio sp. F74 TaxID=700020 RepID=UPI0035F5704F
MAIIHLSGTRLAPQKAKAPLNRTFMFAIGFVFIIAMHIYIPNLDGIGLALPFNTLIWACLGLIIAIGFYHIASTKQIRYTKLTIALLICCFILTLPVFYPIANLWLLTLPRLASLWSGWLFFVVLQQFNLSNLHKQRLLWFIVIAAIIEVVLGYVQFFNLLPKELLGSNTFTQMPFGIFQDPSVMVSFISTGLVISGYLLARQQRKYGQKVSRTLFLYLVPLITAPLIIILARELEWIGTAFGFVIIATYLYRFSTPQRFSGWISSSVAGIGFGLILISANSVDAQSFQKQQIERSTLFPQAIDMLIEKPFTGYGYGRFEPEYILYSARQHQLNSDYPVGYSSVEHPLNETLYWGIEGGLIPIVGIFLAMIMVLFKIYSARRGTRLAIFSLFIPIVLHSQMGAPFYHSAIHWLVFIILLYWIDQRTSKYKVHSISKVTKVLIRSTSFVVPTVTSAYMLMALQTNMTLFRFEHSFPKDSRILTQTVYPISQQLRYEWNLYSTSLKQGLLTGDALAIKQYIVWALQAIRQKPQELYYSNLIMAYLGLGEISKANQIRSEASFLFPNHDFSTIDIEPIAIDEEHNQNTENNVIEEESNSIESDTTKKEGAIKK